MRPMQKRKFTKRPTTALRQKRLTASPRKSTIRGSLPKTPIGSPSPARRELSHSPRRSRQPHLRREVSWIFSQLAHRPLLEIPLVSQLAALHDDYPVSIQCNARVHRAYRNNEGSATGHVARELRAQPTACSVPIRLDRACQPPWRPVISMYAPSSTNRLAVAEPIPVVPTETTATLPGNLLMTLRLSYGPL